MFFLRRIVDLKNLQAFNRSYTTKPETIPFDIDSLLERVRQVTSKAARPHRQLKDKQKRTPRPFFNKILEQKHAASNNTTSEPRLVTSKAINNKNKISDELGNAFTDISSNFSQPQTKRTMANKNTNQRKKTNFKRAQPQSSIRSTQLKTNFSSKPRGSRDQRPKTSSSKKSAPFINPNYEAIQTKYTPHVPNVSELLSDFQITSQTSSSRILKAYQLLQHDENADVSGILNGKFSEVGNGILQQMKTPALRLNANVAINSLNKNSSLDYETKSRILKPLTGLAPVKHLFA